MDSDSPLSNIDPDEVIADSEGEENTASWAKSRDDHSLSRGSGQEHTTSLHDFPVGQIDYFAGFQEPALPVSSIAERAKTRQRKSKAQRVVDILELTDEDELNLKPAEGKGRKKTKPHEKSKDLPALAPAQSSEGIIENTVVTLQSAPLVDLRMVNSKPKVAPRPVKKKPVQPRSPLHQLPQPSIPVPTSPFPPQYYPPDTFLDHDLPPSDPPPTSPLQLEEQPRLPPIEFLPPDPNDSDAPMPSSHLEENVDELQEPNTTIRNSGLAVPQPPPTFFAGSSSPVGVGAQAPAVLSPRQLPADSNLIDLTDIPSTLIQPAAPVPNVGDPANTKKARKPRKPRKKLDAMDDGSRSEETPQPSKKNKGKGKAPQVVVEIPLPLPGFDKDYGPTTVQKRKRGHVLQPDELHHNTSGAVAGPSSLIICNDKEDANSTTDAIPLETEAMPPKGRQRKRKELPDADGLVPYTDKAVDDFRGSEKVEENRQAARRPSKKRKKSDEDETSKASTFKSSKNIKAKGRNVIRSDDDDDAQLNQEDPPLLLEEKEGEEAESETIEGNPSHGNLANQVLSQNDRDPLRDLQPVEMEPEANEPDCKKVTEPVTPMPSVNKYPSLSSRYSIAPKVQTSGMSELLRRVNSHPSSPFAAGKGSPIPGSAYSPYLKSSRRTLSRIAPLHPNRKPPPPPLPPPPPRKKSKKELELEEKWEDEIIDEIGGITEWLALSESEKKDLKRAKRDREMGYCED